MRIEVDLGTKWLATPITISAGGDCAEVTPEQIFTACNRILSEREDMDALESAALKALRAELEKFSAPSMSSGDTIRYYSDAGTLVRSVRCEPIGWCVMA